MWHSYSHNNVSLVLGVLIFSGGFAAAVTTPLDVAKTRIMLAKVRGREVPRQAGEWPGYSRVSVGLLQNEIQHLLIIISALVLEGRTRCEQALHAELTKLLCSFP